MIYYLPARTDLQHYDYQTDLEGAVYTLELYWDQRSECWLLSVYDAESNPIVSDRKVLLGSPLLGRGNRPSGPPGTMIAIDTTGANVEAGISDLGDRVQLVYLDSTEALS